jgi:hypothetical protein
VQPSALCSSLRQCLSFADTYLHSVGEYKARFTQCATPAGRDVNLTLRCTLLDGCRSQEYMSTARDYILGIFLMSRRSQVLCTAAQLRWMREMDFVSSCHIVPHPLSAISRTEGVLKKSSFFRP